MFNKIRIHSIILLVISLLCSGCTRKKTLKKDLPEETLIADEIKQTHKNIDEEIKVITINKNWEQKCSVILTEEVNSSKILKNLANSLGVHLNIVRDIKINYRANKKKFIDILLDICAQLSLMVKINDLNGNIQDDETYVHNFILGNLSSSIGTEFSTSVDHSFGDLSTGNVSKNLYKNYNNYYENIAQNLNVILPKSCSFTINPQAGIITVVGTQKYQKIVNSYINSLKTKLNDQVLVEAKILEIELLEEYSFGVDLDVLKKILAENFDIKFEEGLNNIRKNILTFSCKSADNLLRNFIVSYLSNYGKTNSVSNPYLLISNNHVGIFKAVENKIYFKFKSETVFGAQISNKNTATNRQSEFVTYPVGVTFSVHVVKLENNLIKLYIKPTITQVSEEVEDAGYKFVLASEKTNIDKNSLPKIPIIKTREMESVLVLKDGQYAVIGGLIGTLCKKQKELLKRSNLNQKTELIILLRVQSFNNSEKPDPYFFLIEH